MAKTCDVCGVKLGLMNNYKISDGNICALCTTLCSSYQTESVNNMKEYRKINKDRKSNFSETQILKNFGSEVVHIDSNHKLFYIGKIINTIYYSFDEIVNYGYDITELETTTKKKGGITRALVGGALAGPVGAVVGSSTAKAKSTTSSKKTFYLNLKTYSGNKKILISFPPKGLKEFADKCISQHSTSNDISELSITDKLKTISELKEQGIITEEEFNNKKKELLSKI